MKIKILILVFLFIITGCVGIDSDNKNYNRYLLLDDRIIHTTENVSLQLGSVTKDPNNPLFGEDFWEDPPRPWEARFDNMYPNVIYDKEDGLYKIWYKSFVRDISSETVPIEERPFNEYLTTASGRQRGILYAYSEDGLNWIKPELGLVEFEGDRDNNILIRDFEGGVFKDEHDKNPERRFKMFGRVDTERQMSVVFSENGIDWQEPIPWPIYNTQGDAHNNAIWAPEIQKYVGITRRRDGVRTVERTVSEDFINWSDPVEVLRGDSEDAQIYSLPIFHYANIYIGLPSVLSGERPYDPVDTELAWSPDTEYWFRITPGEAIIPRGENIDEYPNSDYDAGCIFASVPVITENEILIYYGGSNYYHNNWRETSLNLARMRLDGFAGYENNDLEIGTIQTNYFTVTGNDLIINTDVNEGGSVRIAVGESISGFTLDDSQEITNNVTDAKVSWDGSNLLNLKGKKVAFNFELKNAKLFSLFGHLEFD